MKTKITFVLLVFFLISCQEKKEIKNNHSPHKEENRPQKIITINQIATNYDTLVYRIREKGDRDSYDELFYSLMESTKEEQTDSIMAFSEIMAEKYQYKRAYFDYFAALCRKYNIRVDYSDYGSISLLRMNPPIKKHAEDWLRKMIKNKLITEQQYDSIKK